MIPLILSPRIWFPLLGIHPHLPIVTKSFFIHFSSIFFGRGYVHMMGNPGFMGVLLGQGERKDVSWVCTWRRDWKMDTDLGARNCYDGLDLKTTRLGE